MIEVGAAFTAAEKATDDDLAALETELAAMDAAQDDIKRYLAADMNFHRTVARATQNAIIYRIVEDLIDLLEHMLNQPAVAELPAIGEGGGTHRAVYEAIARHDTDGAAAAMRDHLQFSAELWQGVIKLARRIIRRGRCRKSTFSVGAQHAAPHKVRLLV